MRELTDKELNAVSGGGWRKKVDVDIRNRDVDVDIDQDQSSRISGRYNIGNIVQQAQSAPVLIGNFFS